MPRLIHKIPKYALHKASGQARVKHKGNVKHLGVYGTHWAELASSSRSWQPESHVNLAKVRLSAKDAARLKFKNPPVSAEERWKGKDPREVAAEGMMRPDP